MSGHDDSGARANFTGMGASTPEDWSIISMSFVHYSRRLPDRILAHLKLLDGDFGGFPVDRLTHSLQTATLAHRDGRDFAAPKRSVYASATERAA